MCACIHTCTHKCISLLWTYLLVAGVSLSLSLFPPLALALRLPDRCVADRDSSNAETIML